jgi:menaquinone-dependent protoporphyrinogen oxidase
MNVLIAYASTEGQTRKIANFIADHIRSLDHKVKVFDTGSTLHDVDVNEFDKVILAASVHQQKHQDSLEIYVAAKRKKLEVRPTLFVSVSLAAAFTDTQHEATRYMNEFLSELGWQPSSMLAVAGAVRHDEYGYYREQILEHVVLDGIHLDDVREDREFTDWGALASEVDEFVSRRTC